MQESVENEEKMSTRIEEYEKDEPRKEFDYSTWQRPSIKFSKKDDEGKE